MTRWSSSYDCIRAQINGKNKHTIHEWSQWLQRPITPIKVKSVRTLASFNNHADYLSVQFLSKINCFKYPSDL